MSEAGSHTPESHVQQPGSPVHLCSCPGTRWGAFLSLPEELHALPLLRGPARLLHGGYQEEKPAVMGRTISWAALAQGITPSVHHLPPHIPHGMEPGAGRAGGASVLPSLVRSRGRRCYPTESRLPSCVLGLVRGQRSAVRFMAGSWHWQPPLCLGVSTNAAWIFILLPVF